jgi:hypothetical protein
MADHGTVLVTRDQGEPVRTILLEMLDANDVVEVNLDNVEAYTPSFVDEVFGKCLEKIGGARFKRQVRLVASESEVRKLVNLVLSNRSVRTGQRERA